MQKARAVRGQDLCCLMSNPAEKPEVVQLPSEPPIAASVNSRRAAAQRVREARDRLTSTSGTRPAFDSELLRQYAQTRISASFVVMLLVVASGILKPISDRRQPSAYYQHRGMPRRFVVGDLTIGPLLVGPDLNRGTSDPN